MGQRDSGESPAWPLEPGGQEGQAPSLREGRQHWVSAGLSEPSPAPPLESGHRDQQAPPGQVLQQDFLSQKHGLSLTATCNPPASPVSREKLAANPSSAKLCEPDLPARTSCGTQAEARGASSSPSLFPAKSGNLWYHLRGG